VHSSISLLYGRTSEKCFDDTVVLTSGDDHFFIPLMARNTPDCFDFAAYSGAFSSMSAGFEEAQAQLFKAGTIVTDAKYVTYTVAPEAELFLETDDIGCSTINALKAGNVGNAKYPGVDVSPEDVEEWKKVIADNIDMLEEKYGSQEGANGEGMFSFKSFVLLILVLVGAIFGVMSVFL